MFGGERVALCDMVEMINFLPELLVGNHCIEDQGLTHISALAMNKIVVLDQEGELVISSRDSDLVFLPPEKESIFPHTVKAEKFGTYPFFVHGNGGEFQNYAKIQDKLFGWNDKSKEFVKKAARHNFKLFYDEVEISYNDLCKEFLK